MYVCVCVRSVEPCWNKNFKVLCAYDGMFTASNEGFKFMFVKQISLKFNILTLNIFKGLPDRPIFTIFI